MTDEVESEVRFEPVWREPSMVMATGLLEKPKQCHADAFCERKLLSLNLFNMPWGLSFQSEVSYTYRNTSYTTNVQHFSNTNRQISLTALITSRTGTVAWVLLTSLSGRALALPPGMSPKSRQPVFPTSTYLLKWKKKALYFCTFHMD